MRSSPPDRPPRWRSEARRSAARRRRTADPRSAVARSEARTASPSIAVPSRPGTTTALLPLHGHAGGDSALGERRQLVRQRGATGLVDAQHRLYVPVHGERHRERAEASGDGFACGVVGDPLARRAVNLEDVGRSHPHGLAADHDLDRLVPAARRPLRRCAPARRQAQGRRRRRRPPRRRAEPSPEACRRARKARPRPPRSTSAATRNTVLGLPRR